MSTTRLIKLSMVVTAGTIAAVLVLGPLWVNPPELPADRPAAAQRALAVFVLCMSLWLTNIIPLAATGLAAIALLALLDILPQREVFALFGNEAVFFMLGVFLLAAAMIGTGLSKRLTLVFLQRFDRSPYQLVAGTLLAAVSLSLLMPEHAVAAMIFPIVLEVTETLRLKRGKSDYAKMLFLALAWGSIIGGVGTFLGGARAPLALSFLADYDEHIGFVEWFVAAAPVVVIMTGVAWVVLCRSFTLDVDSIQPATRMLDDRVRRLGPMSSKERRLAVLGVATIASWIILGHDFGLGVIAIASATMLFVLRIADWRQVQDFVNWGVLVMYGGAVALGTALDRTQAFGWAVDHLANQDVPPIVFLGLMATVAILLTEGISNSAAVAILLPIGLPLCEPTGVSHIMMTLAVTIPAGLAFSLPVGSPPNAICYSAGYYSIRDAVRRGVVMSGVALGVFWLTMALYWPLVGVGQ